MCFSATTSFAATAVIAPSGVYAIQAAFKHDRRHLYVSFFVLVFAAQQFVEGFVWLALSNGDGDYAAALAWSKAFLFFSHFFWPIILPLVTFTAETDIKKRRVLAVCSALAVVFAAFYYLPLLAPGNLSVEVKLHSIQYVMDNFFDAYIPRQASGLIYMSFIVLPLVYSSNKGLRHFGWLMAAACVPTLYLYYYAFTSVWCFFAAILSLYIVVMIRVETKRV